MKKSIFLFFAAILYATSLNAAYFYRGNQNSWGATEMTTSSDGFYSYYKAKSYKDNGNQNNNFKIATSKDGWNYNADYLKSGFNGTNVTNMGKWDGDNCGIYHTTAYYVLIYHPNSAINTTDKPIICASTTLPDSRNHGFEQDNNGIKFYHGSDTEWKFNGQNAQTKNLNTITQLYLKEWFVQLYENWDGAKGNVKMQYNIHLAKNTPGNYTDIEKNWTDGQGTWSNYYSYPKYGNNSLDINLLEGLGSGKYTMSFKYYDKDLNITSPIHKLNWTIAVPDIASAECTSNGTGSGTEDSPFLVPEGDILTLTVEGTQESDDANSELYAQFASNEYSSTLTHDITPTTTVQSITINVKYYNSTDKLSSNEQTLTIYYKAIQEETNEVTISYQCNGNKIDNIDNKIVKVGVSTPSEITAPAIAGYTFDSWEPRDGITQKSVAENAITIITKTGFNKSDYTLVANYNEDLTTGWVLKGSFVDDFATAYDFVKKSGESTSKVAYVSIDLVADKEYHFKVVKNDTWYGNSNNTDGEKWWIKQTTENWTFKSSDGGDCYMKSGLAGTYTFKIDYSDTDPKVSVIYPITYTVTAAATPTEGGTITGTGTFAEGTSVYLEATPNTGYEFVNWKDEETVVSTEASYTFTVTKDVNLTANFQLKSYEVTTTATNGTVTGAGTYNHGATVTLTATPNFDYKFVKWSNGSTDNPLNIVVTEDIELQAIFAINTYTVTATATEGGTVTGAGTYDHGTSVTLTATPNTGYEFVNWTQEGVEVSADAEYTFTLTNNVDITANFESLTITLTDGDNSAIIAAKEGKKVNVQVNRTFKANDGYYTICLPFDLDDASEIGKAYQVTSISNAGAEGFYMVFNEVKELSAGQPYLIEPKDLTNPIFKDVTIVNTTGETVTATGAGINFEMVGVINGGGQTELGQYWVGDNGRFYNGDGTQTTAKLGLRVLFNITNTEGQRVNVRARVVVGENTTTSLDNITNGENTTIKVIENGQLIIIRNGEKFNAQGQKL